MQCILYPLPNSYRNPHSSIDALISSSQKVNDVDIYYKLESGETVISETDLEINKNFINRGNLILKGSNLIVKTDSFKNFGRIILIPKNFEDIKKSLIFELDRNVFGDNSYTGIISNFITNKPSFKIKLSGPSNLVDWSFEYSVNLGEIKKVPCYFSRDGGKNPTKSINIGDKLYWNASFLDINLYKFWKLEIIY